MTQILSNDRVAEIVSEFATETENLLTLTRKHGSPLYVFDEQRLLARAHSFTEAFKKRLPEIKFYYAMKSNNHPWVSQSLIGAGFGLDVSSGLELTQALELGADSIIFSGPGKTEAEHRLALAHHDRVTVLLDSFGELQRLSELAASLKTKIRAGVRLTTDERGLWRKFGIPPADLPTFMETARDLPYINLRGIQFHTSWNMNPDNQVQFIKRLGSALQAVDEDLLERLRFIDIGGGYWPPAGEWLHYSEDQNRDECLNNALDLGHSLTHYYNESQPIGKFASAIADAVHDYLLCYVPCTVFVEPGRWLCHEAMHILLTVVDKKSDDLVITDGGTNIIGWERYETDYFPVINLSRPANSEHPCLVLGSLCTPHDVWGYSYFGNAIEPGDVLLIPTQGAYTYSLRQDFIKPAATVVRMKEIV